MINANNLIATAIRNVHFPSTSITLSVNDKAVQIFNRIKNDFEYTPSPTVCIAISAQSFGVLNEEILKTLSLHSGTPLKGFIMEISKMKTLLDTPTIMDFDSIIRSCELSEEYIPKCKEIHRMIKEKDPDDLGLDKPSVYGGIILALSTKKGDDLDKELIKISRKLCCSPLNVNAASKMVLDFLKENTVKGVSERKTAKLHQTVLRF